MDSPMRADEHYARSWRLDGIEVLRAADGHGDGRTVKAYATPFDVETEITDQHGHYMEVIDRTAFNRTLSHGIDRVGVFYHHGLTIHGTPSDLGSVPIGSPLEIRPDGKGLLTVTRYNQSPLSESVLDAIRNGDIRGYSFRGRIVRSNPNRIPRQVRISAGCAPDGTRPDRVRSHPHACLPGCLDRGDPVGVAGNHRVHSRQGPGRVRQRA